MTQLICFLGSEFVISPIFKLHASIMNVENYRAQAAKDRADKDKSKKDKDGGNKAVNSQNLSPIWVLILVPFSMFFSTCFMVVRTSVKKSRSKSDGIRRV